tara:strand:+ start:1652 stop:1900 length:249 start_codon:yes stop_codon:yes gene_type:complete
MTWNELLLDVEQYMERYRHALEQIVHSQNIKDPEVLRALALAALDGEPTTADKFNVNLGDEIEYKWVSPQDPGDEHDTPKQS